MQRRMLSRLKEIARQCNDAQSIDKLLPEDTETLDELILFLFETRFGLSESGPNAALPTAEILQAQDESNSMIKALRSATVTVRLSDAMVFAMQKTDKPVVRRETIYSALDWLGTRISNSKESLSQVAFEQVIKLVMVGLTDIWSAIRKGSARRLSKIVPHLGSAHLEQLFNIVVEMATLPDTSSAAGTNNTSNQLWRQQEGALMGICAIIDECVHTRPPALKVPALRRALSVSSSIATLPSPKYDMLDHQTTIPEDMEVSCENCPVDKKAAVSVSQGAVPPRVPAARVAKKTRFFPTFVTMTTMSSVVFGCISHVQLCVRQAAIKTAISFLSRCEERTDLIGEGQKEAVELFEKALGRLQGMHVVDEPVRSATTAPNALVAGTAGATAEPKSAPPSQQQQQLPFTLLGDAEAEGVLELCTKLGRFLPSTYMESCLSETGAGAGVVGAAAGQLVLPLPLLRVLDLYCSHPASTVRQMVSEVFQQCILHQASPALYCEIYTRLVQSWELSLVQRNDAALADVVECLNGSSSGSTSSGCNGGASHISQGWKWREAQMFIHELLLKELVQHLIEAPRARCSPSSSADDGGKEKSAAVGSSWLHATPKRSILRLQLVQVQHCFLSDQFELRRMAEQMIPTLTQLLCLLTLETLLELWTSIPCYLGARNLTAAWLASRTLCHALAFCKIEIERPPPREHQELGREVETQAVGASMAAAVSVLPRPAIPSHLLRSLANSTGSILLLSQTTLSADLMVVGLQLLVTVHGMFAAHRAQMKGVVLDLTHRKEALRVLLHQLSVVHTAAYPTAGDSSKCAALVASISEVTVPPHAPTAAPSPSPPTSPATSPAPGKSPSMAAKVRAAAPVHWMRLSPVGSSMGMVSPKSSSSRLRSKLQVERNLCVALVPLLPAYIHSLFESDSSDSNGSSINSSLSSSSNSSSSRCSEGGEASGTEGVSRIGRGIGLLPILLRWLEMDDDKARWVVPDATEARTILLASVHSLLSYEAQERNKQMQQQQEEQKVRFELLAGYSLAAKSLASMLENSDTATSLLPHVLSVLEVVGKAVIGAEAAAGGDSSRQEQCVVTAATILKAVVYRAKLSDSSDVQQDSEASTGNGNDGESGGSDWDDWDESDDDSAAEDVLQPAIRNLLHAMAVCNDGNETDPTTAAACARLPLPERGALRGLA